MRFFSIDFGLLRFLVWIFIILLIAYIIHLLKGNVLKNNLHSSSSLNILRERYARGEIESEEYQRRKEELTK